VDSLCEVRILCPASPHASSGCHRLHNLVRDLIPKQAGDGAMSKSGDVWPEVRWRSGLIPDRRLESGEIFPVVPNIIDLRILFFYGGGVPGDTRELEGNYEAQQDGKEDTVSICSGIGWHRRNAGC
jgi:hypothetical protein